MAIRVKILIDALEHTTKFVEQELGSLKEGSPVARQLYENKKILNRLGRGTHG